MIPSLYGCIKWLAENNYKIELFLYHPSNVPLPEFGSPNVRLHVIFYSTNTSLQRISRIIMNWCFFILKNIAKRPDYIIATEHWGLLLAGFLLWNSRIKIFYYNLELRLKKETTQYGKKLFLIIEALINRRCTATIIQDQHRAAALANEHNLDSHKFVILPNSPIGYANRVDSLWLQKKYNIPTNKAVLLYVGGIIPHFMSAEIAKKAKTLSENVVLVFHSPPVSGETPYRNLLRQNLIEANSHVFISEQFLEYNELQLLVMSAHIGIALCKAEKGNELNEELMGLSSGKIALYLQCGIPVITSNYQSLKWVEDNGCGICIHDTEEIDGAINSILADYEGYRTRAMRTFDKLLSLNSGLEQLKAILDQCA
jgi:glycosyltransferase involved in cell wall biosynthesis